MSSHHTAADNQYRNAAAEYDKIASKYSGEAGWSWSQDQAKEQANWQSKQAAANAGAEANIAARTAGVSKARAANSAAGTAANVAGNAYTQAYNNAQANALNYTNNQMAQAGQKLATEQAEAQNSWTRKNEETPLKMLWR